MLFYKIFIRLQTVAMVSGKNCAYFEKLNCSRRLWCIVFAISISVEYKVDKYILL